MIFILCAPVVSPEGLKLSRLKRGPVTCPRFLIQAEAEPIEHLTSDRAPHQVSDAGVGHSLWV